jgi:sodium/potassium-transporting ATPase subunit alpha
MFANLKSFLFVFIGAAFIILMVYVPPFNVAFGTYYLLNPASWLISVAFGVFLWVYSIVRTYIIRLRKPFYFLNVGNPIKYSSDIDGLQMHPTRWSTGGR